MHVGTMRVTNHTPRKVGCNFCGKSLTNEDLVIIVYPKSKQLRFRCSKCLQIIGRPLSKKLIWDLDVRENEVLHIAPPKPNRKQPRFKKPAQSNLIITVGRKEPSVEAMKTMPYEEYLKTTHWMKLSDKVVKLAGGKCVVCNSIKTLQAHHKTYIRRGEEELSDLVCLCRVCHSKIHSKAG